MNSLETKPDVLAENPAGPSSPRMGRWIFLVIVLIIVGVLLGLLPRWKQRQDLIKESRELATESVQVISAAPAKSTASLMLPAEVRPYVEAPIYARAGGFLKRWYVDIGTAVTNGQPLADIDAPEVDQQLDQTRAELVQAEAAQSLAKLTSDRWVELLKTSSVSEQENAEKQADLKLKIATVDAAKANALRLEDMQSFTHVVAPFAGIVTLRDTDVGDLISSGKELFRLADTSKLRVFVRVPQSIAPGIAVGLTAEMNLPENPSHKIPAKVVRTAGAIDANSRTLLTELEVDNPKGELLAGSYAQVSFADLKQDPALVLPSNTLLFRKEGLQVGIVGPDNKVSLHDITIGRDYGRTVEVLSGITATDKIIVNPADALVSGTVVRVMADAPDAGKRN